MRNSEHPRDTRGSGSVVATAIRVELARKNTTQLALAAHLNLSQPAIHRRMVGKVDWRIEELTQVAEFLGVGLATLVSPTVAAS